MTNGFSTMNREPIDALGLEIMPTERIAAAVAHSLDERVQGAQWVVWPGVETATYDWNPAVDAPEVPA